MKIVTYNAVYVQKNDLVYLNYVCKTDLISIPKKIENDIELIDSDNGFEFVKFREKSEIEYFKGLDWIIDYNEIKGLSIESVIKIWLCIAEEKSLVSMHYNEIPKEEQINYQNMFKKCKILDLKMYNLLRDIIWLKNGNISLKLPKDIDCSYDSPQEKILR